MKMKTNRETSLSCRRDVSGRSNSLRGSCRDEKTRRCEQGTAQLRQCRRVAQGAPAAAFATVPVVARHVDVSHALVPVRVSATVRSRHLCYDRTHAEPLTLCPSPLQPRPLARWCRRMEAAQRRTAPASRQCSRGAPAAHIDCTNSSAQRCLFGDERAPHAFRAVNSKSSSNKQRRQPKANVLKTMQRKTQHAKPEQMAG